MYKWRHERMAGKVKYLQPAIGRFVYNFRVCIVFRIVIARAIFSLNMIKYNRI